jgi:hypothetical protein
LVGEVVDRESFDWVTDDDACVVDHRVQFGGKMCRQCCDRCFVGDVEGNGVDVVQLAEAGERRFGTSGGVDGPTRPSSCAQ